MVSRLNGHVCRVFTSSCTGYLTLRFYLVNEVNLKRKMGRHCAAYGCANNCSKESCKKKNISFHSFPLHDPPRLQKWLVNLRRKDFVPTSYSAVCSEHFNEKDFLYQSFTKTRLLKRDAVPTVFPYIPDKENPILNER